MKPPTNKKIEKIGYLLNATKYWNGGYGLIVPPRVAEILTELGYADGYTARKPMSAKQNKSKV